MCKNDGKSDDLTLILVSNCVDIMDMNVQHDILDFGCICRVGPNWQFGADRVLDMKLIG